VVRTSRTTGAPPLVQAVLAAAALFALWGESACAPRALAAGQGPQGAPEGAQQQPAPETVPPAAPTAPAPGLRTDQAGALLDALANVEAEGFSKGEFTPEGLDALMRSTRASDRDRAEALLESAILDYARAQHGGRLAPSAFDKNWGLRPAPYDPRPEFAAAVAADGLGPWLESLPPPSDRYRGLRAALSSLRKIRASGGWGEVPWGGALKPGDNGTRVLALRRRLAAEEADLADAPAPAVFDEPLEAALRRFQHNVGLNQTGVMDAQTLNRLNIPLARRIRQIEANMERWRWYPRALPATRIEANIAAEEMDAFVGGEIALEMRAAPGRPDDQTPILASAVGSVVFDPPWNVPASIAKKELWPKEAAHPGYLAAHGYKVLVSGSGDETSRRIVQPFSAKSSLGRVKFDFPNAFAVYLHDTPSRAAFGRTSRAVSHGCVRLQRPQELAELLFKGDEDWPPERIAAAMAAGKTVRAALPAATPIFLMYWTAFIDVKGRVNFRDDVYGWDEELMGLIDAPHT
jgi:murein L,D-transpeptidase YcbB/YkuD